MAARRRRPDDQIPRVRVIERGEFLARYWVYKTGNHVTVIGPTGSGKTRLGLELLERSTSPERPGVIVATKPRDATVTEWTKRLGYQRVKSWPPPTSHRWSPKKPPGWTLWPPHSFNAEADNDRLSREIRSCLEDSYKRGNRAIFADEIYEWTNELGLEKPTVALWSRGRSLGAGLWACTQRPTHVPLWAYSQADHLFLHNDPDARARKRFEEIGGVDPEIVGYYVERLPLHHFLYIRRADRVMCIVDKGSR